MDAPCTSCFLCRCHLPLSWKPTLLSGNLHVSCVPVVRLCRTSFKRTTCTATSKHRCCNEHWGEFFILQKRCEQSPPPPPPQLQFPVFSPRSLILCFILLSLLSSHSYPLGRVNTALFAIGLLQASIIIDMSWWCRTAQKRCTKVLV